MVNRRDGLFAGIPLEPAYEQVCSLKIERWELNRPLLFKAFYSEFFKKG
jgi:hypothetical protein